MRLSHEAKDMIATIALALAIILALNMAISPESNRDMFSWTIGLVALAIFFWLWSRREATAESDAGAAEAAEEAVQEAEDLMKRTIVRREDDANAEADDLTRINGIGAVFQTVLNEAGIRTYATLARASVDELEALIEASGRSRPGRLETWPQQAELAAKGDWDALARFADELQQ